MNCVQLSVYFRPCIHKKQIPSVHCDVIKCFLTSRKHEAWPLRKETILSLNLGQVCRCVTTRTLSLQTKPKFFFSRCFILGRLKGNALGLDTSNVCPDNIAAFIMSVDNIFAAVKMTKHSVTNRTQRTLKKFENKIS